MQSFVLHYHVGEDGILHLNVPVDLKDVDLEITLTVKHLISTKEANPPQGKGWPSGFFEETFGCFQDDPLVIDSDGVFEDQEDLG